MTVVCYVYVKKPECPARKSGDEWPAGLEARQPPCQNGFFFRRGPVRKHKVLHLRVTLRTFVNQDAQSDGVLSWQRGVCGSVSILRVDFSVNALLVSEISDRLYMWYVLGRM